MIKKYDCVVVANGAFPTNPAVLEVLHNASVIIACDGAVEALYEQELVPAAIVGDLDSIPLNLYLLYADRIHLDEDQETNDLTKAVYYAREAGYKEILIMGATGLREDHTLGNISLLMDYALLLDRVEMVTDFGLFTPLLRSTTFSCKPGQQISFFSITAEGTVTTHNLRYPLHEHRLTSWWQGTLNETLGTEFSLTLSPDAHLILFRAFS